MAPGPPRVSKVLIEMPIETAYCRIQAHTSSKLPVRPCEVREDELHKVRRPAGAPPSSLPVPRSGRHTPAALGGHSQSSMGSVPLRPFARDGTRASQ
jgi:hypothetical protein